MPVYSPISKIQIKNFRNIGQVEIDFNDSPIISLIGENEAGKTSVVKAFSVCALHSTPRDQKDYIRDGTNGFGVAIELQDGTVITRIKTPTLNRYNIKRPDGTVWDATKLEGLPVEVQSVMGLIEEPETKEYLQVRTYEDQLLFVVTPASTNYKVMYNALKVGQLTNAIKAGSKEANALKQEVNSTENGIETLTASLRGIKTFDIEPLLKVKTRIQSELDTLSKLKKVSSLIDNITQKKRELGAIAELQNATEVNEVVANSLYNASRTLSNVQRLNREYNRYNSIDSIDYIDTTVYDKLLSAYNRNADINTKIDRYNRIKEISNSEYADEQSLTRLISVVNLTNKLRGLRNDLSRIDVTQASLVEQLDFDCAIKAYRVVQNKARVSQLNDTLKQVNDYCVQMSNYIKSLGAAVEMCPNCGESVVIDIDKYAKQ